MTTSARRLLDERADRRAPGGGVRGASGGQDAVDPEAHEVLEGVRLVAGPRRTRDGR
jgi:hypothetical protein